MSSSQLQTKLYRSLWYDAPAQEWTCALPVGNGKLGAMLFGGVQRERVLLNEDTIWAGGVREMHRPDSAGRIRKMRELLFERKYAEAEQYCREQFMVEDTVHGRYQPLGALHMEFDLGAEATDYRRELDIADAVGTVTFRQNGVQYRRRLFASAVDQVIVLRLSASEPGSIDLTLSVDRPCGLRGEAVCDDTLVLQGRSGDGNPPPGVGFEGWVRVLTDGGRCEATREGVRVGGADAVTVLVAAATDYNLADPASPLSKDLGAECRARLAAAAARPFEQLLREHVRDHRRFFDRLTLDIECPDMTHLPMDRRVAALKEGGEDPQLLLFYFHYCRYLLICASRPGSMPSNLLGVWNPMLNPPWHCHYQYNVNTQENYWIAEPLALSDCHEPFFDLTEALLPSGRRAAEAFGCRGFTAAGAYTTAWLVTACQGATSWGMWVVGGGWNLQHFMQHYRFTLDRQFLQQRTYPLLAEQATFFLDWLVEDPETGELVSGPSASPENRFLDEDGNRCVVSMGCSCDQEVIWDTFTNLLEAAEVLGLEDELTRAVEDALERLAMPAIGSDGRLMEWRQEFQEAEPGHRHVSHLYGGMPGNRITVRKTPELAEAVRQSINGRLEAGYHAQGWSLGWVVSILVRLLDGQKALELIENMYCPKLYPNLFIDAHGQVQVGDMMGVPAAMAEMLVQSHDGEIQLLPALPEKWSKGALSGFCAEGAFSVSMQWQDGELQSAAISSRKGGPCTVRYGNRVATLNTRAGEQYRLSF